MVEVLVTLIVMSVGLLGIASLYVTTLNAKTTSLSRMKAVNLAYDMADRIRANPAAINKATNTNSYLLAEGGNTSAPTDCATTICTPTDMAAYDLNKWHTLLNDTTNGTGLPGTVKRSVVQTAAATATTPEVMTITIKWEEPNQGTLNYALQVQI